ncbi:hypothetical protein BDR07DRAFT_1485886 [Suillus spraguei]|nr:hypothetical protein BDR07DRAFT_1485886 [Suillus spraguei]
MTIVSNDPFWWPLINANIFYSYFAVVVFVVLVYDWGEHDDIRRTTDILQVFLVLMFGQEVELIWRQRWSLMTLMYLGVRYLGIFYAALCYDHLANGYRVGVVLYQLLGSLMTATLYCHRCFIVYVVWGCIGIAVEAILWFITLTQLYAMYLRSRKILIFLIVIFLAVNIFNGVAIIMSIVHSSGEELILSGIYQCSISYTENFLLLYPLTWVLGIVLEVCDMCLAVWIAVKHFRELRRHSAQKIIISDCFTVLIKIHVLYIVSSVIVSCFQLIYYYTPMADQFSMKAYIYSGSLQILQVVQMFVLGPRLILGIREHHAKLVTNSDTATAMTSIAFQERVHISIGSSV